MEKSDPELEQKNKPHTSNLILFTDGSYSKIKVNGQTKELCGYGIYWPNGELPDISRKFTKGKKSNQRAELFAIYVGIIISMKFRSFDMLSIYTDSEYSINCLTVWVKNWEVNGWVSSKKKPVENQDIIKPIYSIISQLEKSGKTIVFTHVRAHTGKQDFNSLSNAKADELATSGANS